MENVITFGILIGLLLPRTRRESGVKVIGVGVHIYVCRPKKSLNRTLAIDLPFQTYAV